MWVHVGALNDTSNAAQQTIRTSSTCFKSSASSENICCIQAAIICAGAAIAINMPMTVDAVVIYLGIIYAGCTAVSIADSFAPSEISTRLRIANTKAIFVQDVILRGGKAHPLYERVVKAQGPTAIVLPSAPGDHLQVCRGWAVLQALCCAMLCCALLCLC